MSDTESVLHLSLVDCLPFVQVLIILCTTDGDIGDDDDDDSDE